MTKLKIKRFLAQSFLSGWSAYSRYRAGLETRKVCQFAQPLRVAFVKHASYRDLYYQPGRFTKETVFSSDGRSGPVGLIEPEFNADFFIVNEERDGECQVYREKPTGSQATEAVAKRKRQWERMEAVAVASSKIDWSAYDLVWVLENAVPARTTKEFPKVLWGTMLEDHSMPSYGKYLRQLPEGYDLFFNQAFGPTPRNLYQKKHVLDWPYSLLKHDTIRSLFPEESGGAKNNHLAFDQNQDINVLQQICCNRGWEIDPKQPGELIPLEEYLRKICQSKVYWAVDPWRALWGNASAEAASAGAVVLANPSLHWNPFIPVDSAQLSTLAKAERMTQSLMDDEHLRKEILEIQDSAVDWHCFYRPLGQLLEFSANFPRELNIQSKIVI